MGKSLQDQLRALGLDAGRSGTEPEDGKSAARGRKHDRNKRKPGNPEELTLERAYALRARDEQQDAQRARERKREQERRRRETNRAIREIVSARRENRGDAEIARNFMYRGRIRKIYVTAEQQAALTAGDMGIVYLSGGYHIVPAESVRAVREIAPDHVIGLAEAGDVEDSEYPVPDDLVW